MVPVDPEPAVVRPVLRLVLAVSLDGRLAPPVGGAAQIGGPGDRRVLEEALTWADAALVGAQTLRLHGSTCLIHAPDLLERRRADSRPPQPLALVASRSGVLDTTMPFFRQPLERWLLAPAAALQGRCPALQEGFARGLVLDAWGPLLAELAALGQRRLVVLGGARLATSLLAEGLVDELQLTLCPQLLGGRHVWLPCEELLPAAATWRLIDSRPLGGDELLLHYRRGGDADQRGSTTGA